MPLFYRNFTPLLSLLSLLPLFLPFRALNSLSAALPLLLLPRLESGVSGCPVASGEQASPTALPGDIEGAGEAASDGSFSASVSAVRLAWLMRAIRVFKCEGSGLLQASERTDSGV